jgi:hypothetical protein
MADPAPVSGNFLIQEPVSANTNNLDLKRQQALLHEKNKSAHKTHIVLPLDIRLASGIVVYLDPGWGPEFSGNWLIEECTHRIGSAGETMLEMHKCMGWSPDPPVNSAGPNASPTAAAVATPESGSPTPLNVQLGTNVSAVPPGSVYNPLPASPLAPAASAQIPTFTETVNEELLAPSGTGLGGT